MAKPSRQASHTRTYRNKLREQDPVRYTVLQMHASAQKRAKQNSLDFALSTEYLVSISPERCPVFNWELSYGGGRANRFSPSLDRILPDLGYVEGNVQIISQLANRMKQNATPEELRIFADWVRAAEGSVAPAVVS